MRFANDFFRLVYKDRAETVAKTASLALFYWLDRQSFVPTPPIEGGLLVRIGEVKISFPYTEGFLPLVVAACERNWNSCPAALSKYLEGNPKFPANLDFKEVVSLRNEDREVASYERVCKETLEWLLKNGDLISLEIPVF